LFHTVAARHRPAGTPDIDVLPGINLPINGVSIATCVLARPGVVAMLRSVATTCDIAIWTASTRDAAETKVNWLEERSGVSFVTKLYRDSCTPVNGLFVKDLDVFTAAGNARRSPRLHPAAFTSIADIVLVVRSPTTTHTAQGVTCHGRCVSQAG
jgi:TFIIF-interacting CTD phosphatase-like protein